MKKFSDKKTKKKFKLLEDFKKYLFKEPQPYLNLDQIDFLLIGDESQDISGLCQLCSSKSSVLKTIKRSSSGSLQLIHTLLFSKDYSFTDNVQDEFRGLEASVYINMDLGNHYKEYAKKKDKANPALDILIFIKTKRKNLPLKQLIPKEEIFEKVEKIINEELSNQDEQSQVQKKRKKKQRSTNDSNGDMSITESEASEGMIYYYNKVQVDVASGGDGSSRGKGKKKKRGERFKNKEPSRWADVNFDNDKRNATGDYSQIEIIDPITQLPLKNLNLLVESSQQLEAIHIQSPMFEPQQYLVTVHKETDSSTFYQGIQNVKAKLKDQTSLATKKDLVVNNYGQFLAAKMTLDDINKKFLSTQESNEFLDELEEAMKSLRVKAQLKLRPLIEQLEKINDCVMTNAAVKQIIQLLKINRQIHLSIMEEDDIKKAIDIIQRERGIINRAQYEIHQRQSKNQDRLQSMSGNNSDIRSEAIEKVLHQMDRTFKRIIERVGQKIIAATIEDIQFKGLEQYQVYLEILFSLMTKENQPNKLRKNSVDFILQALRDRVMDLIDQQTYIRKDMDVLIDDNDDDQNEYGEMPDQRASLVHNYSEKDIKEILFPREYSKAYLENRQQKGSKTKSNNKLLSTVIEDSPQKLAILEQLAVFKARFLCELTVINGFMRSNMEIIQQSSEERLISDILNKLRDQLSKILFIKLRPTHVYREGVTVQEITEITKFDYFFNDNITVDDSVQISQFLQEIIELQLGFARLEEVEEQKNQKSVATKTLSDIIDQIQQSAVNNWVCNAFIQLKYLKINPYDTSNMNGLDDEDNVGNFSNMNFNNAQQSGDNQGATSDMMIALTGLQDLSVYFTKTWFKGKWMQVPIFIYGFFNQLCMEIHLLKKIIKEKEQINFRQLSSIMLESSSQIVKNLVKRMQDMIVDKRIYAEQQWEKICEMLVLINGFEMILNYGLQLLKDILNTLPLSKKASSKKNNITSIELQFQDSEQNDTELDIFNTELMDQIFQEAQQSSFKDVRPYVWDAVNYIQYMLLEIYQVFPSLNKLDGFQASMSSDPKHQILIQALFVQSLQIFGKVLDETEPILSNHNSRESYKNTEGNVAVQLELKQRLYELDFLGDCLMSNIEYNQQIEEALEKCHSILFQQIKRVTIGKDGIHEVIDEDEEDQVNADGDQDDEDYVNQKTFVKKNPNQIFEIDILSNDELEIKKKSLRDLKFKSEHNLGGILSS
ncbi:UNKNOWN [Stylonychia lemnae]|uniref:Exocyst complex component EXOC2/Sec5 N-terminal domain-containing protein n=1 Tax=Stylonychia lemnae TaxID=5949 RepID=A0A078AAU9_STYLE|nr:UNKNOWN [Stylonychia lemnae]|eukprot:CDW79380.1 UNKNOWN [Stylonychia lemnae]